MKNFLAVRLKCVINSLPSPVQLFYFNAIFTRMLEYNFKISLLAPIAHTLFLYFPNSFQPPRLSSVW